MTSPAAVALHQPGHAVQPAGHQTSSVSSPGWRSAHTGIPDSSSYVMTQWQPPSTPITPQQTLRDVCLCGVFELYGMRGCVGREVVWDERLCGTRGCV